MIGITCIAWVTAFTALSHSPASCSRLADARYSRTDFLSRQSVQTIARRECALNSPGEGRVHPSSQQPSRQLDF
jgi:hypothetical protein